ncbi:MAG: hypothetical protein QHH05_04610, partial [Syntrophomonadaceae bacterium]|nr:hypothetical protein [Syntrophomonadaceae bacterium]
MRKVAGTLRGMLLLAVLAVLLAVAPCAHAHRPLLEGGQPRPASPASPEDSPFAGHARLVMDPTAASQAVYGS